EATCRATPPAALHFTRQIAQQKGPMQHPKVAVDSQSRIVLAAVMKGGPVTFRDDSVVADAEGIPGLLIAGFDPYAPNQDYRTRFSRGFFMHSKSAFPEADLAFGDLVLGSGSAPGAIVIGGRFGGDFTIKQKMVSAG